MELQWFEIYTIIHDLIDMTKENLIRWQSYEDEDVTTYFIDLGDGRITICRQYESMDDEYDYTLEIFNKSGEAIYGYMTGYEDRENQSILQKLYQVAEDSKLQREATIDSIRAAISKIKSSNAF